MAKFKPDTDVKAKDEFSHVQELPPEQLKEHFQDHIGIGIFGRAGDMDVLVVGTIYRVGGDVWGIKDGCLLQTNMLASLPGDRVMRDNSFVGNRMDPANVYTDLKVTHNDDEVVWAVGNRKIICRPPFWELKGEHMGVDINIRITGTGKSMPYHGLWENLPETGIGGNEQLGRAEGSFTHNGKTYEITQGWAVRERSCLGAGKDVMALLGAVSSYIWGWCFTEQASVFCYAQRNGGGFAARVFLDGRVVDMTEPENMIEELAHWTDPLTLKTHATAWKIRMNSAEGMLELDVQTWSRCMFGFHQRDGFTSHHGALGRCSGSFTSSDGDRIIFDDTTAYFEQGCATPLGIGTRPDN
ncbi:MAG: hypothetical protein EX271_08210 [Acidimicrobiales bacterium]|nr:hypothetical protein [Hyphomonadaceae bacterium]RZV41354.1 MAG: hypothetical protein EX271_08210 [Acidimicrobiales bacterium]